MANLLIVDDDQDICDLLSHYLESYFSHIYISHNIPDAILATKTKEISFVLIDLNLTSGNGTSLVKYLRRDDSLYLDTPILVISADINFDASLYSNCIFLAKPFKKDELNFYVDKFFNKTAEGKGHSPGVQEQSHPELLKILKGR
jgi:DNA-binding NtrC family response regulator